MLVSVCSANACDFIVGSACYSLHSHMLRSCLRSPRFDSSLHCSSSPDRSLHQPHRPQVPPALTICNLPHVTINTTLLSTKSTNNAISQRRTHAQSLDSLSLISLKTSSNLRPWTDDFPAALSSCACLWNPAPVKCRKRGGMGDGPRRPDAWSVWSKSKAVLWVKEWCSDCSGNEWG